MDGIYAKLIDNFDAYVECNRLYRSGKCDNFPCTDCPLWEKVATHVDDCIQAKMYIRTLGKILENE